jgi:hypothetical protein
MVTELKDVKFQIKRAVRGTHSELTDPALRLILANELLVLRAQNKLLKPKNMAMTREQLWFVVMGLDTALRRVQDVREHGMENVYRQFYPEKEKKQ